MTDRIAILPARGGSKRIPRKNIRDFAGKPALAWPLQAALNARIFDQVVVSTDDAEIADIARAHGADVPFTRTANLSDDHAGTTEVIRDAVARLSLPDDTQVCCIYPTALFLRAKDIASGVAALESGAAWVMSACEYPTPIDRAYKMENGVLVPRDPSKMPMRSQDLPPAYFDAGQFYWANAATWRREGAKLWDNPAAVLLPFERVVDIDTEQDWSRAETMFAYMSERSDAS